jgi:hypothetical protein
VFVSDFQRDVDVKVYNSLDEMLASDCVDALDIPATLHVHHTAAKPRRCGASSSAPADRLIPGHKSHHSVDAACWGRVIVNLGSLASIRPGAYRPAYGGKDRPGRTHASDRRLLCRSWNPLCPGLARACRAAIFARLRAIQPE